MTISDAIEVMDHGRNRHRRDSEERVQRYRCREPGCKSTFASLRSVVDHQFAVHGYATRWSPKQARKLARKKFNKRRSS